MWPSRFATSRRHDASTRRLSAAPRAAARPTGPTSTCSAISSSATSIPSSGATEASRPTVTWSTVMVRSEEHTSELQSQSNLVCRLLLEKKNIRSSLMAVNIHITIIELNALHTKRQNLFQELDAVIHLLMEAKHWGLKKSRNATSLNSRFKSLDTLKVKIISVSFFRVIRTPHKNAPFPCRHHNI